MFAAQSLLVPMQCEFFALEGLSQLLQTVERIRGRFNSDLSIMGVALTMYDRQNRLTEQVADDVRACLGNVVFNTVIPSNVRLTEAPSNGMLSLIYDRLEARRVGKACVSMYNCRWKAYHYENTYY